MPSSAAARVIERWRKAVSKATRASKGGRVRIFVSMNDIHAEVKGWRWVPPPRGLIHWAMSEFRRTPALALALAGFLTQFDVTAVVVVLPSIGSDLGFGISGYAWVMDAYSLAFTAALLASGALADRFGRRLALLAGNAMFAAA